ncbi:hypothetical protein WJX72_012455 [[Myrmecia] bisecta]|uniref:Ciliogenesis and planar polarity effector 2 n=1 Tax=[Myrmecia] bisecta TaxID=41462 RepID=A0AAW1QH77_9CHLO
MAFRGLLDVPEGQCQQVKVHVTGKGGVGKTALIRALCGHRQPHKYHETVGLQVTNVWRGQPDTDEDEVATYVTFWEVGASYAQTYKYMLAAAGEGAAVVLAVFSMTDRASFQEMHDLVAACDGIPCVMVATKCDALGSWNVTMAEVQALAMAEKLPLITISNANTKLPGISHLGLDDQTAVLPAFVELVLGCIESTIASRYW